MVLAHIFRDGLGSGHAQQDSFAEQVESGSAVICRLSILKVDVAF